RDENTKKLDEMRATVDEKLQSTLETRLGESFKQVSDRLEQVHRGLGEMQNLAVGVGDLKRVLGNVKTRGGWGEVQLAALLADALTPQQYEKNVETRRGSNERVEFAIRLPGRDDQGQPCWLPIDAKFPLDDWQRLQEALERADIAAAEAARRALVDFLRQQARSIRDKYVEPPQTTDFAILFLPTEGLYAEMLSRPGFADALQREYRVMLAGPMSLWALLNSLQMGFRTLAIEQRSSEVWRVLGAVKTEFRKFGDVLTKTKDRIDKASEELEKAGVRRRALERQLRSVDELPEPEAVRLIGTDGAFDAGEGPEEK
ncbi:MAG: DNA recombination protein RmuC, partial [Casimicrobiaceae bacterium]